MARVESPDVGAVAVGRSVAAPDDAPPSRGTPAPPVAPALVVIVIFPSAVRTSAATNFPLRVRLSIPPNEVLPGLAIWRPVLATILIEEGEVLHHSHVREHLILQPVLDTSWLIMMNLDEGELDVHRRLLSIRISDGEPHPLGDLAGIHTPRPQVVGPCTLPATSVLLYIVDSTGAAKDQGRHILPPSMRRDPLIADVDPKLQIGVHRLPAFTP